MSSILESYKSKRDLGKDQQFHKTFDLLKENNLVIVMGSERVTQLVKSLKNFARLDEADRQTADLHEGLENTLTILHHELKDRVVVIKDYGDIPKIDCYPTQLNQVFLNILANASQAIDGTGQISIKTSSDKDNIYISIKDTGKGISQDNIERIFDPGFTTKGVGVGTGLGLSISYNIIQKHDGDVTVKSELDRGTTFILTLPIQKRDAELTTEVKKISI